MKVRCREVLASLGLIAVVLRPAAAQQQRPASLRGTITDGDRPLGTASVQIFGLDRSITTSEEGAFRFRSTASPPDPERPCAIYQLEDVEAVEVYRNATNVPMEFARAASCGLVVVWLR